MNESLLVALVAIVGIIAMSAIAYVSIRIMINNTKHSNKRNKDKN